MLTEIHDRALAEYLLSTSVVYGDFLTTSYEPTHFFVSLGEVAAEDRLVELISKSLKRPDVVGSLPAFGSLKNTSALEAAERIFGLAWAPESLVVAHQLAFLLGKTFGYVEFPKEHGVSARLLPEDLKGKRLGKGEKVVVVDDVCVTGTGLGRALQQVSSRGAYAIGLIVNLRSDPAIVTPALGGHDAIALTSANDLGVPTARVFSPIDMKRIADQRAHARVFAERA